MSDLNEFWSDLTSAGQPMETAHRRAVFVERACDLLVRGDAADELIPCTWLGKGTAGRKLAIDAASGLQSDGTVVLVIAAFAGDGEEPGTLSKADTHKHFQMLQEFAEESLPGGLAALASEDTPAGDARNFLAGNASGILKIKFLLVSDQQLSGRVKELPPDNVADVPCEYHVWDVVRLHELIERGHDVLEIDLVEEFQTEIPCLPAHLDVSEYASYLCVVPANLLADLYARHGARLLEANVRGFLSERGKVNRGIRSTIQNEPHMFFAYNNGLTATASRVDLNENESHILRLQDLQIVNGGQTTASLFWARKKHKASLENVSVQMKLSVIPESMSDKFDDIVSKISQCANSQNKVSDADLFANHPFHREMEKISRRAGAAARGGSNTQTFWFYERARAQYENERAALTKGDQKKFDLRFPKNQLVTKTEFAKYWACWEQLPHYVSQGAQKNFKKFADSVTTRWDDKPGQFNELYFKRLIAVGILYKAMENAIGKNLSWYDGYRINIIAYGLAAVFRAIERDGKRLNLAAIWSAQGVGDDVVEELVSVARIVYEGLRESPLRQTRAQWGNLGQWFKETRCWDEATSIDVVLPDSIRASLISIAQHNEQENAADRAAKVDRGIDAQIEVVRLHADGYWQRLMEWNMEDPVLSEVEYEAVIRMARLPRAGKPPSEKDCVVLMEAKRRAETNAFA